MKTFKIQNELITVEKQGYSYICRGLGTSSICSVQDYDNCDNSDNRSKRTSAQLCIYTLLEDMAMADTDLNENLPETKYIVRKQDSVCQFDKERFIDIDSAVEAFIAQLEEAKANYELVSDVARKEQWQDGDSGFEKTFEIELLKFDENGDPETFDELPGMLKSYIKDLSPIVSDRFWITTNDFYNPSI